MLFMLSLLLVPITQGICPNTASAEDVWVYSKSGDDYYVQTHLIKDIEIGFIVPLKLVTNGRLGNNRLHTFRYIQDEKEGYNCWYCKQTRSTHDYEIVNGTELYEKMFDACVPYAKYAKKYPRKY